MKRLFLCWRAAQQQRHVFHRELVRDCSAIVCRTGLEMGVAGERDPLRLVDPLRDQRLPIGRGAE